MDSNKNIFSNSEYISGAQNHSGDDCLKCGHSFSEEGDNNTDILRCGLYNWKIVEDNGACREFI